MDPSIIATAKGTLLVTAVLVVAGVALSLVKYYLFYKGGCITPNCKF
jgi:hypothetical protein